MSVAYPHDWSFVPCFQSWGISMYAHSYNVVVGFCVAHMDAFTVPMGIRPHMP